METSFQETTHASETQRPALPNLLVLSSSLLTERILLFSTFLPALKERAALTLWTMAARNLDFHETDGAAQLAVEPFPDIKPFKEFPYNYLRRLNEYVWDFRQRPPSRMSMTKHVRDKTLGPLVRSLKLPAHLLAWLHLEAVLEDRLESILLSYQRSPEGAHRLAALKPDLLLTTGTFRYEEPAIAAAAKQLGIPTLAFITSWDNPSTKNRMVFKYDGYVVWSEEMKAHLHQFFPYTRRAPIYVVGAPQFDVFFQPRFEQTRAQFCAQNRLDPALPIILYALGSPNFLPEFTAVRHLAEQVVRGALGAVQLLVRPHPLHDKGLELEALRALEPRVVVQDTGQAGLSVQTRAQNTEQICQWVNTFRHTAVIVNLSSTAAIDGAIFDKPVVNLDFDPEPAKTNQAIIKEVNHSWTHFKPIAESGGLRLVNDLSEMIAAVKDYLARPALQRERRRWMAEFVCGFIDGHSGERLAEAVLDFARRQRR